MNNLQARNAKKKESKKIEFNQANASHSEGAKDFKTVEILQGVVRNPRSGKRFTSLNYVRSHPTISAREGSASPLAASGSEQRSSLRGHETSK